MNKEIHQSQLNMLFRCGVQYEFRYIKGLKIPPRASLIIGSGVHKGAEHSFRKKWLEKKLPPLDEVQDIARDEVVARIEQEGILIDNGNKSLKEVKAECVDSATKLAGFHRQTLAEQITPKIPPEREFKVKLSELNWTLAGRIDLLDTDGVLRDLKTASKSPSDQEVKSSLQLTAYALPLHLESKESEIRVALDTLVNLKAGPKLVQQADTRTPEDFNRLLKRIAIAIRSIESGNFMPAYPGSWWCSKEWCGYWDLCPYRGR
ncbi:MAG: hypothetical protein DSO01_06680 [Archaeoglobi archaeon]|nr:MAG: hypothetical protein DSO01_06680 [Archaeoglobi archaeon]